MRHVIDNKSPVYGHTMESLVDGDASFSLTIMGLEKTSMQPIFHSEVLFWKELLIWQMHHVPIVSREGHMSSKLCSDIENCLRL